MTRQIITALKTATRHKHGLLNHDVGFSRPIGRDADGGAGERFVDNALQCQLEGHHGAVGPYTGLADLSGADGPPRGGWGGRRRSWVLLPDSLCKVHRKPRERSTHAKFYGTPTDVLTPDGGVLVLVLAVAGGARVLFGRDTKKRTTNAIGPKVSTLTPADPVLGPVVPGTTPKATVTPNNCQARRCHQAGRGDRSDVDQAPVSKPPAGKPQHCQGGGLLSCVSRVRSGRCLRPLRGSDER